MRVCTRQQRLIATLAVCAVLLVPAAESAAGEAAGRVTIAVVHFVNRNPGNGWDWLETGLADMLITDLSRSARFQVVTRRDMVRLVNEVGIKRNALPGQNRLESFTQAAKVAYVVGGTFELADGRLSVVAHVFGADQGDLKRVEMVSGPATDVFRIEKKVALQLVDRFDVELTAAERALIEYMPTDNIDAAVHFYRGQDLHDRLRPFDALAELKMAVRQDPSYVAAGYMLARLYYTLCGSKHARIELGRVSRVPAEIPEVSKALIDFIRMPGDVDERVAACRMLRNRWYPLTEHESSPGGWASACAAKLLAEAGRFGEALDQLRATPLGSKDRLDELMVGHRAVLRMSGNTKDGVPDGYAWPIILSRESPVVSGPFVGGRAVHGRQLDRRDEVWKMYFQAEQGYWFKSIRAEITVKPGGADELFLYLRRTAGYAGNIDLGDASLYGESRQAAPQDKTIECKWPLAPGTRAVMFGAGHPRRNPTRATQWKLTAELAPLGETGRVRIECLVPGRVLIDGLPAGATGDTFPCVPVGPHEFAVESKAFKRIGVDKARCAAKADVGCDVTTTVKISPYARGVWGDRIPVRGPDGSPIRVIELVAGHDGVLHVLGQGSQSSVLHRRGKAGKGHYHGIWQPGMSSVVMRPLPGLLHNVGGCDVTMAEERGGSWLVAANVYPARSKRGTHILRTWDFMQWDRVTTLGEPVGNPRLVTAGPRLYALFAMDYVGSYQSGLHLVVSVRISRDGGLTWSEPKQIATWPTDGYSGTGYLFAAADDRGTLWAGVPVCGAVRIWSSRDLITWAETKYTALQVYNPRPGTSYNYWKSRLWQCGPDRYRLSFVATDQAVWWAASRDGQHWGPPSVLSPLKHAANVASAGSDAAWVVHDNSLVRLRPRATDATEQEGDHDEKQP